MSNIEKVKELRKATGAGFKDCNNALKEAKEDLEKAIEILRVKGISKASKKMLREANEGVITLLQDEQSCSILEVNCETDFVAKNNDFIEFVKELSELNHKNTSERENLINENMKNSKTVNENLTSLISKIGEKITIGRAKTIVDSEAKIYTYMHSVIQENISKLAVIVSLKSNKFDMSKVDLFGKQLCMHIAASNPLTIDQKFINEDILNKEKELISEELKNTGKQADIIEKIANGKIKKFKEESSLLTQDWVMDPKKKVQDIIDEYTDFNIEIKKFIRLKIGE